MKNLFQKPSKTHFLLAKCVIASLALHSTALYLWINHPILFKAPSLPFFTSTQPQVKHTPAKEEFSVDTALEEFFDDFFVTNKPSPLKSDPNFVPHIPSSLLQGTQLEKTDNILSIAPYRPYLLPPINLENSSYNNISFKSEKEETAHFITFDTPFPSFCPLETEKQSNLHSFPTFSYNTDPLIEDFISLEEKSSPTLELQIKDKKLTFSNIPYFLQDSSLLASMKEAKDLLTSNEIPPPSLLTTSAPSILAGPTHDFLAEASLAEIDDYLPTNNLYGLQWNNSFSLTPSFFADEDGYVFSLTLNSLDTLEAERIKQNFYFLVDVSSSVENHKIAVFKRSVIKALSSLQSGDYFNIFLLDKKITRLSPNNLPFSFQNLRKAEEFLERKNERAIFSSFDLFQGLDKSLDFIESNDEVHTAILLTNGKFSNNASQTRKDLVKFLKKNEGKVSLFTATVGKNNDLVNLDMLSSLSGGKLLYSDTNASLPRKLSVFMKNLQAPLVKDVQLSIRTNDPKTEITLLPRALGASHLYNKEPFIIMGKTNRLCDLQVNLEGKNEEGWILISKEIEFASAEESSLQIKKEWALRQASLLYEKFLQDPKGAYLQEAKEILKMTHGRTLGE